MQVSLPPSATQRLLQGAQHDQQHPSCTSAASSGVRQPQQAWKMLQLCLGVEGRQWLQACRVLELHTQWRPGHSWQEQV